MLGLDALPTNEILPLLVPRLVMAGFDSDASATSPGERLLRMAERRQSWMSGFILGTFFPSTSRKRRRGSESPQLKMSSKEIELSKLPALRLVVVVFVSKNRKSTADWLAVDDTPNVFRANESSLPSTMMVRHAMADSLVSRFLVDGSRRIRNSARTASSSVPNWASILLELLERTCEEPSCSAHLSPTPPPAF